MFLGLIKMKRAERTEPPCLMEWSGFPLSIPAVNPRCKRWWIYSRAARRSKAHVVICPSEWRFYSAMTKQFLGPQTIPVKLIPHNLKLIFLFPSTSYPYVFLRPLWGWALFPVGLFSFFFLSFSLLNLVATIQVWRASCNSCSLCLKKASGGKKKMRTLQPLTLNMSSCVCICSFTVYININSSLHGSPLLAPEARDVICLWFKLRPREQSCRTNKEEKLLNMIFPFSRVILSCYVLHQWLDVASRVL